MGKERVGEGERGRDGGRNRNRNRGKERIRDVLIGKKAEGGGGGIL